MNRKTAQVTIEMVKGSVVKSEFKRGRLVVDRVLDIPCPEYYGFIPGTLAEDGDPIDVFVCTDKVLEPGETVTVEVIGKYLCMDNGISDDKLVAVIPGDDYYWMLSPIKEYLDTYKEGFRVMCLQPNFDVERKVT